MAWPDAFDTFTTLPPVALAARWAAAASVKNTLTRDVATTGAPSWDTAAANLPAPASAGAAAAPSSERLVRVLVAAACEVIVNRPPLTCFTVVVGDSGNRVPPTSNERPVADAFSSCASTVEGVLAGGVCPELCAQAGEVIAAKASVLNRLVFFIISAPERGS
ncbi:hypothetical protein G6F24_015267 [Rhizopus arrhizus]|nr:hypothetical protein G6F24_015267 [Rhizopus arrhizus]